jgi:hypothetical protein
MNDVLRQSRELADESRRRVGELLHTLGLGT